MDNIVESFKSSLKEIMDERSIGIVQLSEDLDTDPSTLHRIFKNARDIKLKTLIRLSDYFQCSLEYLCGKTQKYEQFEYHHCCAFGVRIKEIMSEYDLIPYAFLSTIGITPSRYYYWLSGGEPMLTALDAMAKYLDITLDKLVGRN